MQFGRERLELGPGVARRAPVRLALVAVPVLGAQFKTRYASKSETADERSQQ